MALTRRRFITTSAMASMGVLAARKLAWAFGNSPTNIRKFVKRLPSLGLNPLGPNEDGLYIPVATPTPRLIKGPKGARYTVDYYKMQIAPYRQTIFDDTRDSINNPDGNGTVISPRFFGYQDITGGKTPDQKYLGGFIIAKSGTPVQMTVVNKMPIDHILPVDATDQVVHGIVGPPNRAAIHFHGGDVPWISDGGPFDWFSSYNDPGGTRYGSSFLNNVVPGASGGPGEAEYFYPMHQTSRLCWYHDHAYGLTRINAYAGMASGLLIVDSFEESLINLHVLPSLPGYLRYGIPLVIQDKTFWDSNSDPNYPAAGAKQGDLWYPWQYEILGTPTGRWEQGPYDPGVGPATALPISTVPEFFSDTSMVNGCPYPYLPVEPRHYRFRILNAAQGRFYNLQLYYEDPAKPGEADFTNTKVGMPPRMIQIGTEGGFLHLPVALNNPPVQTGYDNDASSPTFGNVIAYNLLLAPAERADVIIDFSKCPVGSNLVLYSDSPAPFPGGDDLNDYFTGDTVPPVQTQPGMGPNTRTIMQFRVSNLNTLGQGFKPDPAMMGLLEQLAVSKVGVVNPLPAIAQHSLSALRKLGVTERWLSLNEDFDEYGRLYQRLGTLTSVTPIQGGGGNWLGIPLESAPTEVVNEDDTEIWHIVNTTADTHPMHFHLVNVQVLQRQAFDISTFAPGAQPTLAGTPRPPDANEAGWKETVRANPNEVLTMVMKFSMTQVPFPVPNSPRLAAFTPPVNGAEYVWHCHILEHEEHDMMRPMVVIPK
jgi:FtsP/CotA-like multicopper oxidase with cupredoxin domain